jgi:calpain
LPNGLVPDHAYSVLQAVEIERQPKTPEGKVTHLRLIKLRNPYGNKRAWKGAWSVMSAQWKELEQSIKSKHKLSLDPQGEFFMTFKDFVTHFDELNIAHANVNAFSDSLELAANPLQTEWVLAQVYGSWSVERDSAGGSFDDYWKNPQYLFQINEVNSMAVSDTEDDGGDDEDRTPAAIGSSSTVAATTTSTAVPVHDDLSSVIISLMQNYSARLRYESDGVHENSFHWIKFHLYSVNANLDEYTLREHVVCKTKFVEDDLTLLDSSGAYGQQRAVTKRCYVSPGYYVIVPSTYDPNIEANYLLRLFHEKFSIDVLCELH